MRLNFGLKIGILYTAFVAFILFFVVKSFGINFDLEEENYYEKEIHFEEEMDAVKNFNELGAEINLLQKDSLEIILPDYFDKLKNEKISILFKRPSDKKLDFEIDYPITQLKTKIEFNKFIIGVYNVEIKFTIDSIKYLHKKTIYIQ
jgi:hypothetical protein